METYTQTYLPIKIGTQFVRMYKRHQATETVVDIHTTRNLAGKVIKILYVTEHIFCGQVVTDYEVPAATIIRSVLNTESLNKL